MLECTAYFQLPSSSSASAHYDHVQYICLVDEHTHRHMIVQQTVIRHVSYQRQTPRSAGLHRQAALQHCRALQEADHHAQAAGSVELMLGCQTLRLSEQAKVSVPLQVCSASPATSTWQGNALALRPAGRELGAKLKGRPSLAESPSAVLPDPRRPLVRILSDHETTIICSINSRSRVAALHTRSLPH